MYNPNCAMLVRSAVTPNPIKSPSLHLDNFPDRFAVFAAPLTELDTAGALLERPRFVPDRALLFAFKLPDRSRFPEEPAGLMATGSLLERGRFTLDRALLFTFRLPERSRLLDCGTLWISAEPDRSLVLEERTGLMAAGACARADTEALGAEALGTEALGGVALNGIEALGAGARKRNPLQPLPMLGF